MDMHIYCFAVLALTIPGSDTRVTGRRNRHGAASSAAALSSGLCDISEAEYCGTGVAACGHRRLRDGGANLAQRQAGGKFPAQTAHGRRDIGAG